MEISNRSVVMICVTAVVVAVVLRRGPAATVPVQDADNPGTLAASAAPAPQSREPLDSDFRMVDTNMPKTDEQPMEARISPTTTPLAATADPTDTAEEDDPLAGAYEEEQPVGQGLTAPRAARENSAAWAYDAPNDRNGDFTDREMFDRMMGFMDEDQRADFRVVWTAMSPEERDQFLNQMRGNQNGGR